MTLTFPVTKVALRFTLRTLLAAADNMPKSPKSSSCSSPSPITVVTAVVGTNKSKEIPIDVVAS